MAMDPTQKQTIPDEDIGKGNTSSEATTELMTQFNNSMANISLSSNASLHAMEDDEDPVNAKYENPVEKNPNHSQNDIVMTSRNSSGLGSTFASDMIENMDTDDRGSPSTLSSSDEGNSSNSGRSPKSNLAIMLNGVNAIPPLGGGRSSSHNHNSHSGSSSQNASHPPNNNSNSNNWGWFDDESTEGSRNARKQGSALLDFSSMEILPLNDMNKEKAEAGMVTAPNYVLEESLSSQKLWKYTAGTRPPQPVEERAMYEQMWAENFDKSEVQYQMPQEVLKATTPIAISPFTDTDYHDEESCDGVNVNAFIALSNRLFSKQHDNPHLQKAAEADAMEASIHCMNYSTGRSRDEVVHSAARSALSKKEAEKFTVFMKGDNVFGTTVSKSFPRYGTNEVDSVSISIDKYRVVQLKNGFKYAQFLVVSCIGDFRNTVGVWKRFSDFEELSRKVATEHDGYCLSGEDHDNEVLPNAVTSWRLLKKRQRWFRCLDAGYLSLKVFLLERFLHDILFESSSPKIISDFISSNSGDAIERSSP